MISFADCTLPMRAGWCVAGLPVHSVSTAGNVRCEAMHTLCTGKAATLSSLACIPSRFMWCVLFLKAIFHAQDIHMNIPNV